MSLAISMMLSWFLVIAVVLAVLWGGHNEWADFGHPAHVETLGNQLLTMHHCWTVVAPRGVFPTHAVVTTSHGHTIYTGSHRALDHVFSGKHPHLTVWGFCR